MAKKKKKVLQMAGIAAVLLLLVIAIFDPSKKENYEDVYETVPLEYGELESLVTATGKLRPYQSAELFWNIPGRIDDINVEIGDIVDKDAVLASLVSASLPQQIFIAQGELSKFQNDLTILKDSSLARAKAELELAEAQIALNQAQKEVSRLGYSRGSQNSINAQYAKLILAQKELDEAKKMFSYVEDSREDSHKRAVALERLSNAKKDYQFILANYNYLKDPYNDEQAAEINAKMEVAQARYDDAQRELERLSRGNGVDENAIAEAQARLDGARIVYNQQFLKAPFNGEITEVYSEPGDVVNEKTRSFRIDNLSRLYIDIFVPEVDIMRVKVGQSAYLNFDAVQGVTYHGQVSKVGQVGENTSTGINFKITIELIDSNEKLKPGMQAVTKIVVEQLEDVLLVPNRAILRQEGSRYVFVIDQNGLLEKREIVLGATGQRFSVITSDNVKGGDNVVLNPSVLTQDENIESLLY